MYTHVTIGGNEFKKTPTEKMRSVSKSGVPATLECLIKSDDNKYCADCGAKGPRWASVNLGVMVCIDCSGIHRNLGVHISVVKSLTLDKWQPKWIDVCSSVGNRIANEYYENRLPANFRRPVHSDGVALVENFIRAKYQRLEYVNKNCESPSALVAKGIVPTTKSSKVYSSNISCDDISRSSTTQSADITLAESFDLLGSLSPPIPFSEPTVPPQPMLLPVTQQFVPTHFVPQFIPVVQFQPPIAIQPSAKLGLAAIDPFASLANRK